MKWFAGLADQCDPRCRRLVRAIGSAVLVYASALVGVQVTEVGGVEPWGTVLVHIALVVVLVAVIYVGTLLGDHAAAQTTDDRLNLLRRAEHEAVTAVAVVQGEMEKLRDAPSTAMPYVPHDALVAIKAELKALYQALESSQWPVRTPGTWIEFQVTFMTRCDEDDEITIAAWANHADRRPPSLELRAIRPDLYEGSVTAEVYREDRPSAHIVASTTRAGGLYRELYRDQKSWIRSTIVYPVVHRTHDLMGTLVVSCDADDYFRESDRGFWRELLDPFATRIALEKWRHDHTLRLTRNESMAMPPPADRS
jgi:hypothetical protein